ncbi:MAG: pilus assembly protein [Anaerolineae bacterium]|nr:pilus assembly protein [Anaerolineae bacterium]
MRGLIRMVRRHERGQGLVEFALIASLLLLFLLGILDFGRAFLVYTSLFNAAREGARWGAVHPWSPDGVINRVLQSVVLVNPAEVSVTVQCDRGPGTSLFNCLGPGGSGPDGKAGIGDRIVVSVNHRLYLISPIVGAFAPNGLPIQTIARRTIASYGEAYSPSPPGGGGGGGGTETSCADGLDNDGDGAVDCSDFDCWGCPYCPLPEDCSNGEDDDCDGQIDCADSGCASAPACSVPSPENCTNGQDDDRDGLVDCSDPDCSGNPACVPVENCDNGVDDDQDGQVDCADADCSAHSACTILLNKPLCAGATRVTGIAQRGQTVQLRNVNTGYIATTVAGSDNTFSFNVSPLQVGHLIAVQAYGKTDYDIVRDCSVTPTPTPTPGPTPTPTRTPTPTPTPTTAYITLSPTCGGPGTGITITVRGYNWSYQNKNDNVIIYWDGTPVGIVSALDEPVQWTVVITVTVAEGPHTVRAANEQKDVPSASASFTSPCPVSGPNLVVSRLQLLATPPITTYRPLPFQAVVRNVGDQPVNSMFWVDLYANASPTTTPPFSGSTPIGWSAVSGLAVSGTITLTINTQGFAVTGTHRVYAWVDSWNQISETRETDNITGPITVSVTAVGPTPTPSPTPAPAMGIIAGRTYLYRGGTITPISRATVEVWRGSTLIASTLSGEGGIYQLTNIPAGSGYTVVGWVVVDGQYYTDQVTNVTVTGGQITTVPLFLR